MCYLRRFGCNILICIYIVVMLGASRSLEHLDRQVKLAKTLPIELSPDAKKTCDSNPIACLMVLTVLSQGSEDFLQDPDAFLSDIANNLSEEVEDDIQEIPDDDFELRKSLDFNNMMEMPLLYQSLMSQQLLNIINGLMTTTAPTSSVTTTTNNPNPHTLMQLEQQLGIKEILKQLQELKEMKNDIRGSLRKFNGPDTANMGMPNTMGLPNQGLPNNGIINQGIANQGMMNPGLLNPNMMNQAMMNQGMGMFPLNNMMNPMLQNGQMKSMPFMNQNVMGNRFGNLFNAASGQAPAPPPQPPPPPFLPPLPPMPPVVKLPKLPKVKVMFPEIPHAMMGGGDLNVNAGVGVVPSIQANIIKYEKAPQLQYFKNRSKK